MKLSFIDTTDTTRQTNRQLRLVARLVNLGLQAILSHRIELFNIDKRRPAFPFGVSFGPTTQSRARPVTRLSSTSSRVAHTVPAVDFASGQASSWLSVAVSRSLRKRTRASLRFDLHHHHRHRCRIRYRSTSEVRTRRTTIPQHHLTSRLIVRLRYGRKKSKHTSELRWWQSSSHSSVLRRKITSEAFDLAKYCDVWPITRLLALTLIHAKFST